MRKGCGHGSGEEASNDVQLFEQSPKMPRTGSTPVKQATVNTNDTMTCGNRNVIKNALELIKDKMICLEAKDVTLQR